MEAGYGSRWVMRKPRDFAARFDDAFAFYQQGNLVEAEAGFRKALEIQPNDAYTNVCIAHISLVLGKTDAAIECLDTALTACPLYAEAHALMGSAREVKGELISAELAWQKAIALDPRLAIAHFNLARMYAVYSEAERAMSHLSKAIKSERAFRKEAKCSPDFDRICNHPEFRELVFGVAA